MAELTSQERLQPSLLDRLTDDEPEKQQESRDKRVLSTERLRTCVLRDLGWLLNSSSLGMTEDLEKFPEVDKSVLNYGVTDLTGIPASGLDTVDLENMLKQAIWDFEPRILRSSVRVKAMVAPDEMNHNVLGFEIEGEMWGQPLPIRLYMKTEIDLETGICTVSEESAAPRSA